MPKRAKPQDTPPPPAVSISPALALTAAWSSWLIVSWWRQGYKPEWLNYAASFRSLGYISLQAAAPIATNIVLLIIIFASAFFIGRCALSISGIRGLIPDDPEWSVGLGIGILSHALLLLGLAGLWSRISVYTILGLSVCGGLWCQWRQPFADSEAKPNPVNEFSGPFEGILILFLGFLILLNLLACLGPEFFYDSLVYHLAMPQLYALHGRIIPTPHMIYSGNPFGAEMLYGLALTIKDERLAKLLNWGISILTATLIYRWSRPRYGLRAGLIATLLYYSIPMVCFQSWASTAELLWTLYTLLAVFALLEILRQPIARSAARAKLLALCGCFGGLAMSVKYPAVVGFAVLSMPLVLEHVRNWPRDSAKSLAVDLAVLWASAILTVSPWLLKNWAFYHDPFYPFMTSIFTGAPNSNLAGLMADSSRWLSQSFISWSSFWNQIAGPWSPHSEVQDNLGLATTAVLPLVLWPKKDTESRWLQLLLIFMFLGWFSYSRITRFLMPALPLLCILAVASIGRGTSKSIQRVGVAVCLYGILVSASMLIVSWFQLGLWQVSLGIVPKNAWLRADHPGFQVSYYSGVEYINSHLPGDAKILFLGEERGYYCLRSFVAPSIFDDHPLVEAANSSPDAQHLSEKLKEMGYTHLLINKASDHFDRILARLTASGKRNFDALLRVHAILEFEDKQPRRTWVQVFRLVP